MPFGFDDHPHPAGTHMCLLYADDSERWPVITEYVSSGLANHERVGCFVDVETPEEFVDQVRGADPADRDQWGPDQLQVSAASDVYCPDGSFDVERMLQTLADGHRDSIASGFAGFRVTGEMTWSRRMGTPSRDLVEYEARINVLVRTVPTTAICQYDSRAFDGATLYDILSVHPMVIVRGQVMSNPYYLEPEEFLTLRDRRPPGG